jgi:hypothetical protein
MGLVGGLERRRTCQGKEKADCYPMGRPARLFSSCVLSLYLGTYLGGNTPKALALATACVRLRTPSLP